MNEGVKGFGWNSLAQIYRVLFSSVVLLILARLIPVEDFGVIAMSTVFVLFFNTLLNIGFDSSIVYSKSLKEGHLFSLFLLNLVFGFLIFLLGYFLAPFISLFYQNNEIQTIFKALILGVPLSSLGIVSKGYLQKSLKFKQLAIIDLIAISIAGIFAITLAYYDYGYWSLIVQQLVTVGFASIGYLVISFKNVFNTFSIDLKVVKEHFVFGYNVLIFNITNFVAQQLDILLIGKFLGEKETGLYMLAFNLIMKPISLLIQVFNKTLYPILASLTKKEIPEKYTDYSYIFFFMLSPLIVISISLAKVILPYMLTNKWESITLLLIVFGYQSLRTILASPSGLLFLISGKPDKQWKYSLLVSIPLRVLGVCLGYYFFESALGVALGINLFATIEMFVGFHITFKLINLSLQSYFEHLKTDLINLGVLIVLLFLINSLISVDILSILLQLAFFSTFLILNKIKINRIIQKIKSI